MIVRQLLFGVDHPMQIRLHQLRDYVYVVEALGVLRHKDLVQLDYVFVAKETQQLYLAVNSLGVYKIFKGVFDFFDGHFAFALEVLGGGDDAVGAAAHHLDEFEFLVDVEFGGWLGYRRRGRCGAGSGAV